MSKLSPMLLLFMIHMMVIESVAACAYVKLAGFTYEIYLKLPVLTMKLAPPLHSQITCFPTSNTVTFISFNYQHRYHSNKSGTNTNNSGIQTYPSR